MKDKAVLVIDMPKTCMDCDLSYDCCCCSITSTGFYDYEDNFDPNKDILHNCPLSSLPSPINLRQYVDNAALDMDSILAYQYAQGWNEFRNEILKGANQ